MITGPRDTLKKARKLRSEMSLPELILWAELRKRPGGFKFRRQHPAGHFILDFYCPSVRLAIEVDGFVHDIAVQASRDERRTEFLKLQHIGTLRVPAKVVLGEIEVAVSRIVEVCRQRAERMRGEPMVPLHHASHGPPPPSEEDL